MLGSKHRFAPAAIKSTWIMGWINFLRLSAAVLTTGVTEVTTRVPAPSTWVDLSLAIVAQQMRERILWPVCSPVLGDLPDAVHHDQREKKIELIRCALGEIEEAEEEEGSQAETETTSSLFLCHPSGGRFYSRSNRTHGWKSSTCVTSVCWSQACPWSAVGLWPWQKDRF